jgi:TRAP transporter 4TM/12TM fusion protein
MSRRSIATRVLAGLLPVVSILWTLQAATYLGLEVSREQFLAIVLALALGTAFSDAAESAGWRSRRGVLFCALAGVSALGLFYLSANYQRFQLDFPYQTLEMQVLAAVVVATVLIALWRHAGAGLFVIVMAFCVYALVGHLVPDPLTGVETSFIDLLLYLGFDPNAMLGAPLGVVGTIVLVFVLFGRILVITGCGEFFIDISRALLGRQRGGAAKVSVVASALFGSISGSAISNVVTTGVITIPLMRRSGYGKVVAGAIETIASTGGQLMPPIMGAAAFLMAQFLEVPYADVVTAALIPAVLYFLAVFIQVDLIAGKERIASTTEDVPPVREVLREGWHFLIPFAVLLAALFLFNQRAEMAALYGAAAITLGGVLRPYKGHRLTVGAFLETFPGAGRAVVDLIVIVAGAGFVMGVLNVTATGFAMTMALVQLGGGELAFLLVISAFICILLGMGMPTTGVYVLLAALVAPALIETGIEPIAAHMFILYFGMMSMITPPIALAAFAAATVSGADPMRTGFQAMKLGWVAYVIPLLFVLSPALLLRGSGLEILAAAVFALGGVLLVSVAIVGYFRRPQGQATRVVLVLLGAAAAFLGVQGDGITALRLVGAVALVGGLLILLRQVLASRSVPSS